MTFNSENLSIVFDLGTTEIKGAVMKNDGTLVQKVTQQNYTTVTDSNRHEQDAIFWWKAICSVSNELCESHKIHSVIVTGQMQNLLLLNTKGSPLQEVILYSDQRSIEESEWLLQNSCYLDLVAKTGNEQGPTSLLAKLLWIKKHQPEIFSKTNCLLPGASDYVVFRMTGEKATDTTTASTTGLMELVERKWIDEALFNKMGLQGVQTLLPKLFDGGAKIGELQKKAATDLGIPAGLPVFLGPGDAGSATIGAGCGVPGKAYAYIGTSGWVAFAEKQPADPTTGVITLSHPKCDHFIQVAPLLTAGGNLEWAKSLSNFESYDSLINDAISSPLSNLIFLPYLKGERSPFIDPKARGAFIGLQSTTGQSAMNRAVLEGICFAFRHALTALTDTPVNELILTGGGTRSKEFCQMFADVLNVEILILEQDGTVNMRGALKSAQGNLEEIELFHSAIRFTSKGNLREHYNRLYSGFVEAYPALKSIFSTLHQ